MIFLAKSLVSIGEIELMSTTILPLDRPSATPFAPNSTSSTCGVSGSIRKMISEASATAFGVATDLMPFSASSAGAGLRCVEVVTVWPPAIRCPAMGRP